MRPGRLQSLLLLAGDLARVRAVATLELQVLADGVIEQSHAPPNSTALA
jgi:hypothetical protein